MLIKRVRTGTECAIGKEQCGFRQGKGCMDQVFAVRQMCEKYLANRKDVLWAFIDLGKAYGTIDRNGIWQMPHTIPGCMEWEDICCKPFRVFM